MTGIVGTIHSHQMPSKQTGIDKTTVRNFGAKKLIKKIDGPESITPKNIIATNKAKLAMNYVSLCAK